MKKRETGKIYKIVNSENSRVYIGSTITTLNNRFLNHKSKCRLNRIPNSLLYKEMREIGMDRFKIELIRECEIEDRLQYEREEIEKVEPSLSLNLYSPFRTEEEIKELHKESQKIYREKNKKEINKKITCECGSIISKYNIYRHKKTNTHQNFINSKNEASNSV